MPRRRPKTALRLAEQVTDPVRRESAFYQVAFGWASGDLLSAKEWIESTRELAPETQAFILRYAPTLAGGDGRFTPALPPPNPPRHDPNRKRLEILSRQARGPSAQL